jgi:uncharacterized coiled-coil protein SlyX
MIADDEIRVADVSEVLTDLAAKSLLTVHMAGEHTSRAYAVEKLEESQESVVAAACLCTRPPHKGIFSS